MKIFREDVAVRATVHTINGFSAHADQEELLKWLEPLARPGLKVNLIHGEEESALAFKAEALKHFPQVQFHVPRWKETLHLGGRVATKAPAPADTAVRLRGISERLAALAARLENGESPSLAGLSRLERALESMEV